MVRLPLCFLLPPGCENPPCKWQSCSLVLFRSWILISLPLMRGYGKRLARSVACWTKISGNWYSLLLRFATYVSIIVSPDRKCQILFRKILLCGNIVERFLDLEGFFNSCRFVQHQEIQIHLHSFSHGPIIHYLSSSSSVFSGFEFSMWLNLNIDVLFFKWTKVSLTPSEPVQF